MRVIGITPINNDLKEEKSMKFLQKLGKALMLPVAVLPICGIRVMFSLKLESMKRFA